MVVYMFATIGVLLSALVVYKKTMQNNPLKPNSALKLLDVLRLPERKNIYVVEYNKEKFLIGTSTNSINLISKVSRENEIEKKESAKDEIIEKGYNVSVDSSLFKKLSDRNKDKRGNY